MFPTQSYYMALEDLEYSAEVVDHFYGAFFFVVIMTRSCTARSVK